MVELETKKIEKQHYDKKDSTTTGQLEKSARLISRRGTAYLFLSGALLLTETVFASNSDSLVKTRKDTTEKIESAPAKKNTTQISYEQYSRLTKEIDSITAENDSLRKNKKNEIESKIRENEQKQDSLKNEQIKIKDEAIRIYVSDSWDNFLYGLGIGLGITAISLLFIKLKK